MAQICNHLAPGLNLRQSEVRGKPLIVSSQVAFTLGAREGGVVQDVARHRGLLELRTGRVHVGAEGVGLLRGGLGDDRVFDEVAGKGEVALSGPVWQPMEIVKTSYVSVPGVQPDANTGKKRLQRVLGALPPALLWILLYVTAGFLWLRGGFR